MTLDHPGMTMLIIGCQEMTVLMAGHPGWDEMDHMKFHHVTQNGTQYKIYELFISGISHLVFLDCG